MALFAIPNPVTKTQVDFSIEKIKLSVQNIGLINNKYKFTSSNEIFNQYTFEALEFLSLGVFIDINLNSISENKTEITVEIRRKLGSFNQSHEVTKANEHLAKIFDCIAKLTALSPEEVEELKNVQQKNGSKISKSTSNSFNNYKHVSDSKVWYERTGLVILLCIVFFPVGLYALWKNSLISKGWKISVTAVFAILILANIASKDDENPSKLSVPENQNSLETSQQDPQITSEVSSSNTAIEQVNTEKQEIIEKLKGKARRDWPNDYATQEFWVNEEIEAYEYMLTIEDNNIKRQAQSDWPLDYSTQKFWYNEQIDAKARME